MSNELTEAERAARALDTDNMNRGFGKCPNCMDPYTTRCHECPRTIPRNLAEFYGWRMDHLSGFGCIALCPDCRDDNP